MSITESLKHLQETRKQLQETLRQGFQDALKEFLEEAPEGTTLMWAQYTDYYCDGEPCTFGVCPVTVRGVRPWTEEEIEDLGDEEELEQYQYDEVCQSDGFSEKLQEAFEELKRFIENEDDLMQMLYGDHVIVRISKHGILVEEYKDHN